MQRRRVVPIALVLTSMAIAAGCGERGATDGAAGPRVHPPGSRSRPGAAGSSSTSTSSSTATTLPAAVVAVATLPATSSSTTTSPPPPPPTAPGCATDGTTGPTQTSAAPAAPALLTDVLVTGGECADVITFTFRPTTPAGVPPFVIEPVVPPFAMAASGAPIDVAGSRFLRVRFSPAWTAELDTATPTYTGPDRIDVTGAAAARAVVLYDSYEGVVGWIVGLDGTGRYSVTTSTEPPSLTITIRK